MNLTDVSLYSNDVEVANFSLAMAGRSDRFHVRQILGLDADEIIAKFYAFGQNSGARFFEMSLPPRDIVIRLALHPNVMLGETYSDVRDDIYKAISSSRTGLVDVQFNSSGASISKVTGYIQKVEAAHFNKLPEVQLTIKCVDSIFHSLGEFSIDPADMATDGNVVITDVTSTAPHGLIMEVEFTAVTTTFSIQDKEVDPDWYFDVTPDDPFAIGDKLLISSVYGDKQLIHTEGGMPDSCMECIVPGSIWPYLFPGRNEMFFPQFASFDWVSVKYFASYWGV